MNRSDRYGEIIEIEIERIAQGGAGVGRWQGYVVFAAGALPGERVRVLLQQCKARYAHGSVIDVLNASPARRAPRLPEADHMPWQHIAYATQLDLKHTIVTEQLAKLANIFDCAVAPVIPATDTWGYRNTAHVQIDVVQGQTGYYAAGSRRFVPLLLDPLVLPVLNEVMVGLRFALQRQPSRVTAVTLRASATYGYAVAVLHGSGDQNRLVTCWQEQVPALAGVTAEIADTEAGSVTLHEDLGGIVFSLAPQSFFQVHTAQAEQLVALVRDGLALDPADKLLDAYSGAGTFACPLARSVRQVVAIEAHRTAVVDGERTARFNEIDNVHYVSAAVEQVLPQVAQGCTVAVLDPPRRGCHPRVLQSLQQLGITRLAYISCHPGILARDLRVLLDAGFALTSIQPIDLFPQTPHVECVALLHCHKTT
ncbi:MAG: 23S rRNA (uracil(1939)-C(5))-methyltransferase RlmD [Chloroflexaceae bacterium]|nr:23S rRNA (uracil(1939)-C(5))-methyltransferase RlmD [Chloroflexaceae bacterium]